MDTSRKGIIARRINDLLREHDMKHKEFAALLGIKDGQENLVSYFRSGARTPNYEQIVRIAEIFNTTTDYILGVSNIESKEDLPEKDTISFYLGLNEESISLLRNLYTEIPGALEVINSLLCYKTENEEIIAPDNKIAEFSFIGVVKVMASMDSLIDIAKKMNTDETFLNSLISRCAYLEYQAAKLFQRFAEDETQKDIAVLQRLNADHINAQKTLNPDDEEAQ